MKKENRVLAGVAIILAFVVAAGVIGYGIETGYFGGLGTSSGPGVLVQATAAITAPSSGPSILNVTLRNTSDAPVTMLLVSEASDLPGAANIGFSDAGGIISPGNLLAVGGVATGSIDVWNATAGNVYHFTLVVFFRDNQGNQIQDFYVTAKQ